MSDYKYVMGNRVRRTPNGTWEHFVQAPTRGGPYARFWERVDLQTAIQLEQLYGGNKQ